MALPILGFRQSLFPFVLSLSKYERMLQGINELSSPYPSTRFLHQAQDGADGLEMGSPETQGD
jgi:hypothetical protein